MQGKEKKHKHALLFFSMPLDDHGNLKGYNQGKEKKRLHAPLLLYSYGVSGVASIRNIEYQESRVSGISGASDKGNKRETKASFFVRYFLLYYLVFCVNKTVLLTS